MLQSKEGHHCLVQKHHLKTTCLDTSSRLRNSNNNNYNYNNNDNNTRMIFSAIIYIVTAWTTCESVLGSSELKSIRAKELSTRSPSSIFDIWVGHLDAIGQTFTHHHTYYYSPIRLILIYHSSKAGRLSVLRHCSKCAAVLCGTGSIRGTHKQQSGVLTTITLQPACIRD